MNNKLRKAILTFAVAALLAIVGGVAFGRGGGSDPHEASEKNDPIVGTWNCIVPPGGGFPQVNVIKNIHADGTMIELDNAAPPSQESPTVGNWTSTGERTYTLKLEQFSFDTAGNFVGTFHYTNPLTISKSQKTMAGTFDFTLEDVNKNVLATGSGTVSCTRLGN